MSSVMAKPHFDRGFDFVSSQKSLGISGQHKESFQLKHKKKPESQFTVSRNYMMQVQVIFYSSFQFRLIKICISEKSLMKINW